MASQTNRALAQCFQPCFSCTSVDNRPKSDMSPAKVMQVRLSGGAPWGFRLFGGDDLPLIIAKVRSLRIVTAN